MASGKITTDKTCSACGGSHNHTPPRFAALFPGLPRWAGTRKVKPIWILLTRESMRGSGIIWTGSTLTHTHPFDGPLSRTTRVSRYQKGKPNLDFTETRHSEWQWHQLGCMQVCTSLETDNHARTPPLLFFYWPDAHPATQQTASKHWRHNTDKTSKFKNAENKLKTVSH